MVTVAQNGNNYQFFVEDTFVGSALYIEQEQNYIYTDIDTRKKERFNSIDEIKDYIYN